MLQLSGGARAPIASRMSQVASSNICATPRYELESTAIPAKDGENEGLDATTSCGCPWGVVHRPDPSPHPANLGQPSPAESLRLLSLYQDVEAQQDSRPWPGCRPCLVSLAAAERQAGSNRPCMPSLVPHEVQVLQANISFLSTLCYRFYSSH